jgi:hypothetical protein
MRDQNVHQEQVPAHRAPDGIWVRVCTAKQLLTEYALTEHSDVGLAAAADAELVQSVLDREQTLWTYFYDGDSGRCLKTLITVP